VRVWVLRRSINNKHDHKQHHNNPPKPTANFGISQGSGSFVRSFTHPLTHSLTPQPHRAFRLKFDEQVVCQQTSLYLTQSLVQLTLLPPLLTHAHYIRRVRHFMMIVRLSNPYKLHNGHYEVITFNSNGGWAAAPSLTHSQSVTHPQSRTHSLGTVAPPHTHTLTHSHSLTLEPRTKQ